MSEKYNQIGSFYEEKLKQFSKKAEQLKKRISGLSWLRLLAFVVAFISFYIFFDISIELSIISLILFLMIFIWLIRYQIKVGYQHGLAKAAEEMVQLEMDAREGKWIDFDPYKEALNGKHDYAFDLDIFGEGSLFQFINRTVSAPGKEKLKEILKRIELKAEKIIKRQNAVKELSEDPDWRIQFYALGKQSNLDGENCKRVKGWTDATNKKYWTKPIFRILAILVPAIEILALYLVIAGRLNEAQYIVILISGLAIAGIFVRKVNQVHNQVGKTVGSLKAFGEILDHIENREFKSEELKELQQLLKRDGESSAAQITKLSKIVSALDSRLNMLVGFLLNAILLWDLQQMIKLEKWRFRHGEYMMNWISVMSEFDAINSLATFSFNHPDYAWPTVSEDVKTIKIAEAGHPLIPIDTRISNNFNINTGKNFMVVTGANMAGKSTFLRTVGINMLLASTGCKVCATEMDYKPQRLLTGIRSDDNLLRNESYFFAELKRLQHIVGVLENGEESFILLDEILRGTNSKDKQRGTLMLMKKLLRLNTSGIIATHDLAIGNLEDEYPENIMNRCFEVEIKDDELFFDYKLKEGISSKLNASFLLEKMGIVDTD